jgi:hypothetical protein
VEPRAKWSTASVAAAVVARYGPAGTLWQGVPATVSRPVTALQVLGHIARVPRARWYERLLRRVRRRVDEQDRRVGLVTASLGPRRTAGLLKSLYRMGGGSWFDTVGVDLGRRSPGEQVSTLRRLRRLIRDHGDDTARLLPTGMGWPSGDSRRARGLRHQAQQVRRSVRTLLCRRRSLGIRALIYGRWRDPARRGGTTGLLDVRGHPKPALRAFRSAASSCR